MKKKIIFAIVLVFFLTLTISQVLASSNVYIYPGKSVGKIKLDMTALEVRRMLGKPQKIYDSRNVKNVQYYIYHGRYKMNIAIDKSTQRVVEIAVYAPHFRTLSGIKVGSKEIRVTQEYGKKAMRVNGAGGYHFLFYHSGGINFGIQKGKVKVITIRGNNFRSSEILYYPR